MIDPRLRVMFVIAICVLSFYFGLSKFSESSLTLRQLRLSPESTPNEPNSTNTNFIESNSAKPNSSDSNSTEPSYNVLPIADTEADAVRWQLANQALPVPKRASEGTKLVPYERDLLEGFPPAKLGLQIHRPPTHSTDVHHRRHQIAVVFFGLVKKVVAPQFAAFRDFVAAPLLRAGDVDVFLHTFEESNFSNPRNGEKSQIINQSKSIGLLRNAFSGARRFNVAVSESKEAHDFFGPTERYTRNGNPWGRDGSLSTHYLLRQHYSMIRATEMWTGTNYRSHDSPQGEEHQNNETTHVFLPNSKYSCVLYIRPDMFSETPIAAETIRAMCRHDNDGHRELSVPHLEWEGVYDRAAFGTPEAMLLYGLRGLRLRAFIDGGGQISAEPYLFRYLCENKVVIHIAPWMLRRIRADGSIEGRDINKAILSDRFVVFTDLWRDLQLRQHSKYSNVKHPETLGSEKMRGCLPRALWGLPHVTSDAVKS